MAVPKLVIPTLATGRLSLVPISMEHSAGMYEMWRNPQVQKYSGPAKDENGDEILLPAQSTLDSDKLIKFWMAAAKDGWGFRWALLLAQGEKAFIGHLGFNQLGDRAEIAYHQNPIYWGKGYMYEAAMQAIQWQQSQGSKQVEAFVDPRNLASIRLTERLGLKPTDDFADGARRYHRTL